MSFPADPSSEHSATRPSPRRGAPGPGLVSVTTRTTEEGVTVAVAGELDLSTRAQLAEALVAAADARTVTVDLTATAFIDSTSVGTLVAARNEVVGRGGSMRVVVAATGPVAKVLSLMGLEDVLGVTQAENEK